MTPIETIGQSGPLGSCCTETSSSTDKYWVLKLPRCYPKPDHHIGKLVLYRDYLHDEIVEYFVRINGLNWTGSHWEYAIQTPPNHPDWKPDIHYNQMFLHPDEVLELDKRHKFTKSSV